MLPRLTVTLFAHSFGFLLAANHSVLHSPIPDNSHQTRGQLTLGARTFMSTTRAAAALPKNLADAAGNVGKSMQEMLGSNDDDGVGRDIQAGVG